MSPEGGGDVTSMVGRYGFRTDIWTLAALSALPKKRCNTFNFKKGNSRIPAIFLSIRLIEKALARKVYVKLLRPYLFNEILKEKLKKTIWWTYITFNQLIISFAYPFICNVIYLSLETQV
jgi:hypothetical protein